MKRYNLFMDVETLQKLKDQADRQSSTVSELIRHAVDKMLSGEHEITVDVVE